ncbi:MAG: molybdopterin-guanine dinucleotide biosynthesis protein B [Candidatus Thorarchaeota archaeon]|nr:MAG: molybdopterin-guanine dinucleotide biosynthesis protein B [Candidatus Thorarchaeota archaeon]
MRVFSVSGFSGTGKTTLMEAIVREILSQGYAVITVKSSQHDPKEEEGTDTWKHQLAGAIESIFYGPSNKEKSLKEIVGNSVSDFLIVEGMKTSPIPKFWCIGNSPLGDTIPTQVLAIISWDSGKVENKYGIPILEPENIDQIVSIIIKEAIELDKLNL